MNEYAMAAIIWFCIAFIFIALKYHDVFLKLAGG